MSKVYSESDLYVHTGEEGKVLPYSVVKTLPFYMYQLKMVLVCWMFKDLKIHDRMQSY